MKPLLPIGLFALLLVPIAVNAQSQPASATTYPEWDQLTPAQRDVLTAPLRDRWNTKPGERARMFERMQRWQTLTPEQRKHARRGMQRYEHLSPTQREHARKLYRATRGMAVEERRAFFQKWRNMNPQQRSEWLQAQPPVERRPRP